MTDARHRSAIDYEKLSDYLKVMSVSTRLELLRKLQTPRAVSEIQVPPARESRDADDDRAISRQAVEAHLARLQERGLVTARMGSREGRAVTEWVVNHARLFIVADELRRLSLVRSLPGSSTEVPDAPAQSVGDEVTLPEGPSLVVANGPIEGTAFPLEGRGPWAVGRERGLAVALPYDPFVSKENAVVVARDGAFHVHDAGGSRNGTRVNWRVLKRGESAALRSGDTIGVGRTLLLARGL